ncbi:MAG: multicopper oxidase domain-containing protein [Planctomycetota bacterium]|nr:multicopper oxidase domain-containing protein [Planctomycetota bacterium]
MNLRLVLPGVRLIVPCLFLSVLVGQDLRLRKAIDYNPNPRVFETILVAHEVIHEFQPGVPTRLLAYNGSLPGPTIDAYVGDTLIVHFYNGLREPTTIHWHGVEMPAVMDGSHIAQPAVPAQGYFRYQFKLNTAATFWYHPHINTNQNIERGLYGALIVRDHEDDGRLGIDPSREFVVFLDEIKLQANGSLSPFGTDPTASFTPVRRAEDLANSRLGNHLVINGHVVSSGDIPTLDVLSGGAYRLRLINVTSGRVQRLSLTDPEQVWYQLGSDQGFWNDAERIKPIDKAENVGHHKGIISNPDRRLGVTLTPGDRADVVLVPTGNRGDEFYLDFHDYRQGKHIAFWTPMNTLMFGHEHTDGMLPPKHGIRVRIGSKDKLAGNATWVPPIPLRTRPVLPFKVDLTQPPLPIFFGHSFPDVKTGDVKFFVNVGNPDGLLKMTRGRMQTTPMMFMPKPMMMMKAKDGHHVKLGDVHYWEICNFTGGAHNFHTHGFRFQHIDTTYVDLDAAVKEWTEPARRVAYEDTILIPKRPALVLSRSYTIVRLAIHFDDRDRLPALRRTVNEMLAGGLVPTVTTSGGWLLHCHMLEHAAKGMASFVTLTK